MKTLLVPQVDEKELRGDMLEYIPEEIRFTIWKPTWAPDGRIVKMVNPHFTNSADSTFPCTLIRAKGGDDAFVMSNKDDETLAIYPIKTEHRPHSAHTIRKRLCQLGVDFIDHINVDTGMLTVDGVQREYNQRAYLDPEACCLLGFEEWMSNVRYDKDDNKGRKPPKLWDALLTIMCANEGTPALRCLNPWLVSDTWISSATLAMHRLHHVVLHGAVPKGYVLQSTSTQAAKLGVDVEISMPLMRAYFYTELQRLS